MLKGKIARRVAVVVAAAVVVCAAIATVDSFRRRAREKEIDALVARLSDEKQRDEAERQLAAARDGADIRRIVLHLGDEDYYVRTIIVSIIGRIGAPAVEPLAEATRKSYVWNHAWSTASPMLQWVYGRWARTVPGSDYERWRRCALQEEAYVKIGAPARGALKEMLSDASDENIRRDALTWLGCIGDPRDQDLFISYAGYTPSPSTAICAVTGLGRLKAARDGRRGSDLPSDDPAWREFDARNVEVVQTLVKKLKDSDEGTRWSAAIALGEYRDSPAGVAALLTVVKDPGETGSVRVVAAEALQYAAYPEVRETLLGFFGDKSGFVRLVAVDTLRHDRDSETPRRVAELLGSSDALLRKSAISFFAATREEKDVLLLAEAYKGLDDTGRQCAVTALERIRDRELADLKEESGVVEQDAELLRAAEEALRQIGARDAVPAQGAGSK